MTSFAMDRDELEKLRRYAAAHGITVSDVIRKAIESVLKEDNNKQNPGKLKRHD